MIQPSLLVVFLLVGLVHSETLLGRRESGDQLIYVQYLEAESPTRDDLLLHFKYDGRPRINRISAVECLEKDVNFWPTIAEFLYSNSFDFQDASGYNLVVLDGGAGQGQTFVEFTLKALEATYHRTQCNFHGFYN
jgi:hypothetical protein